MNSTYLRIFLRPVIIFFILINAVCLTCGKWLDAKGIDHEVLIVANLILAALTLITSLIHIKSVGNENPHAFVRGVMLASFIKLMVIAISVMIYFLAVRESVSIYAVAVSMLFYIVYTVIEVKGATKINGKTNAKN